MIGNKKFANDLCGNAVNNTSRMELHSVPGKFQVTRTTYKLIENDGACELRRTINLKCISEMEVWHEIAARSFRSLRHAIYLQVVVRERPLSSVDGDRHTHDPG